MNDDLLCSEVSVAITFTDYHQVFIDVYASEALRIVEELNKAQLQDLDAKFITLYSTDGYPTIFDALSVMSIQTKRKETEMSEL